MSCDEDISPQSLSQSDIQGEWFLTELNASSPVDLNNDGTTNLDLTKETNCFENMKVNFEGSTYQLTYPKIEFSGENNNELNCIDTLNSGSYILEDGNLNATTTIDNTIYRESVLIQLENNTLKFSISRDQVSKYLDLNTINNENSNLEFLEFVFQK